MIDRYLKALFLKLNEWLIDFSGAPVCYLHDDDASGRAPRAY